MKNNTLKRVIADGAYDNKENFRYLYDSNIEDCNSKEKLQLAKTNSVGCYCPRKIAVLKQLKNFEKWKHSVSYGHRWAKISVLFNNKKDVRRICIFKEVSKHGKGDDVESVIIQYVCVHKIENTTN